MQEVYPNLFVGNQDDYEITVKKQEGWYVVQACKDPYHRAALGYTGRAVAKTHPEYLIARRGDRLILNMVDADSPAYIPKEIIDAALDFIYKSLQTGRKVLVHCNQGMSRSPSIAWLYLAKHTDIFKTLDFADAERTFRQLYPIYSPATGVYGYVKLNWLSYHIPNSNAGLADRNLDPGSST